MYDDQKVHENGGLKITLKDHQCQKRAGNALFGRPIQRKVKCAVNSISSIKSLEHLLPLFLVIQTDIFNMKCCRSRILRREIVETLRC
jgi:hypothetical protein